MAIVDAPCHFVRALSNEGPDGFRAGVSLSAKASEIYNARES
jgi:hypothetical protein